MAQTGGLQGPALAEGWGSSGNNSQTNDKKQKLPEPGILHSSAMLMAVGDMGRWHPFPAVVSWLEMAAENWGQLMGERDPGGSLSIWPLEVEPQPGAGLRVLT